MDPIWLIDRSRVETRQACPRKRFLQYDYAGTGLEPEEPSLPLLSGVAFHLALSRVLEGEPLEGVLHDILSTYRAEIAQKGLAGLDVTPDLVAQQSALLEGIVRLWTAVRLPRILDDYDVVSVEKAWLWRLAPDIAQSFRFDALVRRKADGLYFIKDWKSVKHPSDVWFEKFEHNLQTTLYLQALKERIGDLTGDPHAQVGGILYEGIVKGTFRKDTAKSSPFYGQRIVQSPYTIAYRLQTEAGPIYQFDYTNRKGFEKVRTFDEMPMKEWVERHMLPSPELTNDLFIPLVDICPPARELERAKRQVITEERAYRDALRQLAALGDDPSFGGTFEDALDDTVPMRVDRCFQYGSEHLCPFLSVCFNANAQPLDNGGFKPRVPHHDTDIQMVN